MEVNKKTFIGDVAIDTEQDQFMFEGMLAVYDNVDRDNEVIAKGAFAKSLSKVDTVPLLLNHDMNQVIGKLRVEETDAGVKAYGEFNQDTQLARETYQLVKQGALSKMSVGFIPKNGASSLTHDGAWEWSEAEILEGSIVAIPANELANITSVKHFDENHDTMIKEVNDLKRQVKRLELELEIKDFLGE